VADLAGVSRATVSAYLNKTRYVSPELSERIQNAIDKLHYMPDPLARALKTSDANTIGLIIPVMSRFYMPMIDAINSTAREQGYELLIASSEEDGLTERDLLHTLVAKRVTGILVTPCSLDNRKAIGEVTSMEIPVVQVNRRLEDVETDSVVSNNLQAAYRATEHLLAKGRRRIVLFGYDPHNIANDQKKRGYELALRDHNIEDHLTIEVREHDKRFITSQLCSFLDSRTSFDALIATTQGKTVIALQTLLERGFRIPEDVSFIGFDDTPWSGLLLPPLTVVSENTFEMGRVATELLIERIENPQKVNIQHIVLEDEIIIRKST
jgi:DNA-binding LacI/PurR family transcriptional regulator